MALPNFYRICNKPFGSKKILVPKIQKQTRLLIDEKDQNRENFLHKFPDVEKVIERLEKHWKQREQPLLLLSFYASSKILYMKKNFVAIVGDNGANVASARRKI